MPEHRYFVLHKPAGVVSQFVSSHSVKLLGDLDYSFPEGTHAIGRLDSASEGLLLLTTNKAVTGLLFDPKKAHQRTYLVNVKNVVTPSDMEQLLAGVCIRVGPDEYYNAVPLDAALVTDISQYGDFGKNTSCHFPNSWLSITLTEGKYHQVRKMVGAIHHRCRRLIRVSIEDIHLGNLEAGGVLELTEQDFFARLRLSE